MGDLTVTPETAKRLKEAGFPQTSVMNWETLGETKLLRHLIPADGTDNIKDYAAPTAQELSDQLVERRYQLRVEHNHRDMRWYAYYAGREMRQLHDDDADWLTAGDTMVEALANLYIKLAESNSM